MSHFAKVENNIVVQVIVAEQDVIDTGLFGDPKSFIQTSYNTHNGVHLLGGTPLRKNFAGIGFIYDPVADEFNPPSETTVVPNTDDTITITEPTAIQTTEPVIDEQPIFVVSTSTETIVLNTASDTISL